jgi:hypothetical protein
MSRAGVGAFALLVAGLSGCATPARVIYQDSTKVVIAVPDNSNAWPYYYQDAAKELAGAYVHDPVLSLQERVKVGQQATSTSDATHREAGGQRSFGDVVLTTDVTNLTDRYEYHLEFRSNRPATIGNSPPTPATPAATLAPKGVTEGTDPSKPPLPPILPVTAPTSPAGNMPSTALPGPGH